MLRLLETTSRSDPALKAIVVGPRSDAGAGDRSSAEAVEQSAVAVREAAVVVLGSGGAKSVPDRETQPASSLYSRPPHHRALIDGAPPALEGGAAQKAQEPATSPSPVQSNGEEGLDAALEYAVAARYRIVRGADGVTYAVTGQGATGGTKDDPEAVIHDLTQVLQAALAPPTSPGDLQIAARAALDMQRAQLELARERYLREASQHDDDAATRDAATAAHSTDVKA